MQGQAAHFEELNMQGESVAINIVYSLVTSFPISFQKISSIILTRAHFFLILKSN